MYSILFSPRNFRCSIFKCFSFHLKHFFYFFNINNRLSVKNWKVKLVKQFQMYILQICWTAFDQKYSWEVTLPVWPDHTVRSMRSKTIIDCELWKDVLVRSFIVNAIQGELTLIKFLAQLIKKFLIFIFLWNHHFL
jgi:hypothetical protein